MNIPACETIHWNITSRRTHKGCICCPHDFILLSKNTEMFEVISHRPTDESVWFFYFTSKGTCKSAGNSPWDKRVMSHICLYLHVCCTKGRATQDTQVVVSEVSALWEVAIEVWRTALERKLCLFSVLFIYHLLKWLLLDSQWLFFVARPQECTILIQCKQWLLTAATMILMLRWTCLLSLTAVKRMKLEHEQSVSPTWAQLASRGRDLLRETWAGLFYRTTTSLTRIPGLYFPVCILCSTFFTGVCTYEQKSL